LLTNSRVFKLPGKGIIFLISNLILTADPKIEANFIDIKKLNTLRIYKVYINTIFLSFLFNKIKIEFKFEVFI